MKLKNNFSIDTRVLFMDHWWCMVCSRNSMPSLHHIAGRISDSPLNAIVLCDECHSKCNHNEDEEKKHFKITYNFLKQNGYNTTTKDKEFVRNYPRLSSVIGSDKWATSLKEKLEANNPC